MPRISFDGQGFLVGGRRLWIMGAAVEYSLLPRSRWDETISLLRQCGFNTIRTSAPWSLHERAPGRRRFDGQLALRDFVQLCCDHGLWVILRIGPCVGGRFSGGGLPAWIGEVDGVVPREPDEGFMRLVASWYAAVLGELKGLDAGGSGSSSAESARARSAGGVLAVQIEHAWNCGNEVAGDPYFRELRRLVRESSVELPILTANGLWMVMEEAIDVWQGREDLFAHTRQLHRVQADAPAIVEIDAGPTSLLHRVASVLAGGGQAIVGRAAPEAHRIEPPGIGAEAPDRADARGGESTAAMEPKPALVDLRGGPTADLRSLSALARFASRFGSVLGASNGDAIVADPDQSSATAPVVVSRGSAAGRVAFIFAGDPAPKQDSARGKARINATAPRSLHLVSPDGVRLPVTLGRSGLSWVVLDLDLLGRATLDYSTLAPIDMVDERLLILAGAAGSRASLSISGSALEVVVPAVGETRPRILSHGGLMLAICSEAQVESMRLYGQSVVLGADRLEPDGSVRPAPGCREAIRVDAAGRLSAIPSLPRATARAAVGARSSPRRCTLGPWRSASTDDFTSGTSATFASVERPRSLAAYAASTGAGWYRLRVPAARTTTRIWLPGASGWLGVFLDARAIARLGDGDRLPINVPAGPGASRAIDRRAGAADGGVRTLTFLAIDRGRAIDGLRQVRAAGVGAEAWSVEPLRISPRAVPPPMFDPFERRAFVPDAPGAAPERAIEVSFAKAPRETVILDPVVPFFGAVLCNGKLVDVFETPGGLSGGIVVGPGAPGWGRTALTITLVPMRPAALLEKQLRAFSRRAVIGSPAKGETAWAFARWQAPAPESPRWREPNSEASARKSDGMPRWWRSRATAPGAPVLSLEGLTRGMVLIDGCVAGRYDTRRDDSLVLPEASIEHGADLVIFDEDGASPHRVRLRSE